MKSDQGRNDSSHPATFFFSPSSPDMPSSRRVLAQPGCCRAQPARLICTSHSLLIPVLTTMPAARRCPPYRPDVAEPGASGFPLEPLRRVGKVPRRFEIFFDEKVKAGFYHSDPFASLDLVAGRLWISREDPGQSSAMVSQCPDERLGFFGRPWLGRGCRLIACHAVVCPFIYLALLWPGDVHIDEMRQIPLGKCDEEVTPFILLPAQARARAKDISSPSSPCLVLVVGWQS